MLNARPDLQILLQNMPTPKTSSHQALLEHCRFLCLNWPIFAAHYDFRYPALKMRNYTGRQLGIQEIVKRITWGSDSYSRPADPNNMERTAKLERFRPARNEDQPIAKINGQWGFKEQLVIAYGDGSFSPSMPGKLTGPKAEVAKALQRKCREAGNFPLDYETEWLQGKPRIVFLWIDEYLTSKVLSDGNLLAGDVGQRVPLVDNIHAVVGMPIPENADPPFPIIFNRDVNAARNIGSIFIAHARNEGRPVRFYCF